MMYSTDVHNGASYNPLLDTRHLEPYKDPRQQSRIRGPNRDRDTRQEPAFRYRCLFPIQIWPKARIPASTMVPWRNTEKKIESVQNLHNSRDERILNQ